MRRFFIVMCALLLAIANFISFGNVSANNFSCAEYISTVATEQKDTNQIMSGTTIAQEGHIFTMKDFEVKQDGAETTYYLYVNTNITIIKSSDANTTLVVTRQTISPVSNLENKTMKDLNDSLTLGYDETRFSTSSSFKTQVSMTLTKPNSLEIAEEFRFYLIQTKYHFYNETPYSWTNKGASIYAPTMESQYEDDISIINLVATNDCPIYVDFYYNGEFYSIYTDNSDHKFYNSITGNLINATNVSFTQAGEYEIYIYDKTAYRMLKDVIIDGKTYKVFDRDATGGKFANVESYNFVVKVTDNTPLKMYIMAKDDNSNTIVSQQIVNGNVNIKFYNLERTLYHHINVTRSYDDGSSYWSETNELDYRQSELLEKTFVYDLDGTYQIDIVDRNEKNVIDTFIFTVYKTVHRGSTQEGNPNYVPTINQIYEIKNEKTTSTFYKGIEEKYLNEHGETVTQNLKSSTTTTYIKKLAVSRTSINGLETRTNGSDAVHLTVHGVGEIKVTVTKDKNVYTYTLANGDEIPGTSEIGKYTVHLQDQLNAESSITFSISRSVNAPTIALIAVGGVGLALVLFFIIRARTRIQVR